jgi:hypothetical protein
MMSEKRFILDDESRYIMEYGMPMTILDVVMMLNMQQATIDMQELRLQQLEELLELSENLNKSYREKLIDMNLKRCLDE